VAWTQEIDLSVIAWGQEKELDTIVDTILGAINNWDDTAFIWDEITTGKWAIISPWTRETNDG